MSFPTQEQFIESAEQKLGVRLPESFRARLLRENGGEVEAMEDSWQVNPVHDTSEGERSRRTAIDIVRLTASARDWPGFPTGAVAIADDGCGNHLVFLPDKNNGSLLGSIVYVWWHEGSELEIAAKDFSDL